MTISYFPFSDGREEILVNRQQKC